MTKETQSRGFDISYVKSNVNLGKKLSKPKINKHIFAGVGKASRDETGKFCKITDIYEDFIFFVYNISDAMLILLRKRIIYLCNMDYQIQESYFF